MRESEDLVVKASWGKLEDTELVRMEWRIKNQSDYVIIIDGYRIEKGPLDSFRTEEIKRRMHDQSMEENCIYRSNAHVSTVLWPEESRSYIWAYVYPEFYDLTPKGKWAYFVIIRYRRESQHGFHYATSNIAQLDTKRTKKRRLLPKTFYSRAKNTIKELLDSEGIQEIDQVKYEYSISHIGQIDVLILTSNAVMIIEYVNQVNDSAISQIRRYMDWFKIEKEKRIIGLLVTDEPAVQHSKPINLSTDTRLLIASFADNSLKVIEMHDE